MATDEEDGKFSFSALFTRGASSRMAEFCENLNKRESVFRKVHIGTASLTLLAGNYIVQNASWKGAMETAAMPYSCKHLLQFILSSLPHCGNNYLPVFKFIHSFCTGELLLGGIGLAGVSDTTFLLQQLRSSHVEEEIAAESVKGTPPTEESEEQDGEGRVRAKSDSKTDSRSEVQKLFERLKTGRHDISPGRKKPTEEGDKRPSSRPPSVLASDSFLQMNLSLLKELNAGKQLLEFCTSLPVFKALAEGEKGGFLVLAGEVSNAALATMVGRLHQLKCAVEAVSILVQLPALLEPLTAAKLSSLHTLLLSALQSATTATCALGNLGLKAMAKMPASTEPVPKGTYTEVKQCDSIAELFGQLSCCMQPTTTVASARNLICETASLTLKLCTKFTEVLNDSPRVGANVVRNVKTLTVYHTISGLMPLLAISPKGSEGTGPTKQFGYVKFSVPLVELTSHAVQSVQSLLEQLETEEEDTPPEVTTLRDLDLHGSYSCWECVRLLLTNLPLLRLLFSLLFNSFKKAVAVASFTATQPQVTKDASMAPIKTRTEREDRIARLLQMSLSEKISEKFTALSGGEGDGEEGRTPSPVSTVSSSGEVEGVYTLYTPDRSQSSDDDDDSDEEPEDDDISHVLDASEHPLLPFMSAFLMGEATDTPLAPIPPPPPPLPPRRKISKPLLRPVSPKLPPRSIPRKQTLERSYTELKKSPTFYLNLGAAVLKCLSRGLICSDNGNVQRFLDENLNVEHVSGLAWLIQNIEITQKGSEGDGTLKAKAAVNLGEELQSFASDLMEMAHEMIMNRSIPNKDLHSIFLRELGLVSKCWPLQILPNTLSLLGRILICRLQQQSMEGGQEDDHLALGIWKGFLSALEENACEGEEHEEDLDVAHLQLLLFVWHSFTMETRKTLLTQCAHAIMKAAQTREGGAHVSPLVVCRLLLVLDYMLYQFSGPVAELTEQVNHNLFSGGKGTSSPLLSPTTPKIMCYSCEQQLQYQTVPSKPGSDRKGTASRSDVLSPRFYNVRPRYGESEGEKPDSEAEMGVVEEACKTILKISSLKGEVVGYNEFCHALIVLMGCGMEYIQQSVQLQDRVLAACASHQCSSLCLSLLSKLPPSCSVLNAAVDGVGLSCKDPIGASLLIHVLHLCVRLKLHYIDTEDITDTLMVSGYSQDESEEVIARVISVIDSHEHFLGQTATILNELTASADDTSMLPLMCIIATDFLLCLVTRAVLDETQQQHEKEPETKEPPPSSDDHESVREAFFEKHGRILIPALIKTSLKLTKYAHLYALLATNQPVTQLTEIPQIALESLLQLSGKSPLQSKDSKVLFQAHIPDEIKERIKQWNSALLIDPAHKLKLSSQIDEDTQIDVCMMAFLNLHFTAFVGTRTFDPSRSLKSTISSLITLLHNFFVLKPGDCGDMICCLIPFAFDTMTEFAHTELYKLTEVCEEKVLLFESMFLYEGTRYKMMECFKLVHLPGMKDCTLLGPVLADFFSFLSSMLDNLPDWRVLTLLDSGDTSTNVIELAMLAASPTTTGAAIAESLKFLSKCLHLAEKGHMEAHLVVVVKQMSGISELPTARLQSWLRRLVVGSSADGPSEVAANVLLLRKFVELLTREDSKVDSDVGCVLLSTLLPLGSELVEGLTSQCKLLPVFKDFFDSLILLAGTNKNNGHLVLAKAVEGWLPGCINILKNEEELDMQENSEIVAPAGSLLQYLSHLTSAVQFITNMVKCTERRNLAGEADSPLPDSDSEEEEEGTGLPGREDDDSMEEESEEEALNSKLCTYTVTQREFMNQHWYNCHTCKLVDGSGVCTICAKVCHKDHDLSYSKFGSFFCDCGAKEGGSCKALVKRTSKSGDDLAGSPVSPLEKTPFSDPRKRRRRWHGRKGNWEGRRRGEMSKTKRALRDFARRSSFPSLPVLRIVQQIDKYKAELRAYLDSSGIADHTLRLLHRALPPVVSSVDQATSSGCNLARQAMIDLHSKDKEIEYTDNLMAATLGSQEGAFENVRLNFTGDQGQVMRQLISNSGIRRVAMCALSSYKGKRQHLCVNHEKGKLTFLQLFPILKQADSNRRKLTLTRLSTTSVPFTVLSMSHNTSHEDFMIVCGLKEAQLLVVNASGQVTNRALLHPSVDTDGYIVKSLWIPNSQTELVVITDTFVKIYDLRIDLLCPMYYFIVLTGKIKDATIAVTEEGKFLVIMTSTGQVYSQPIIPACNAMEGPVYFTIDIQLKHPSLEEADGQFCGGGASIYYSHTLQMLFLSYCNGKSFIATVNDSLTEALKVFGVPLKSNSSSSGGKGSGGALVQWMEVQYHPGLICALSQATSNPVVLLVKPEQVQVHELKALPNKAKVQGMVAMRQPPLPGEPSSPHRTTLIILCEDGSLRIYVANNNANTEYWLQPQFQPASPLAILRSKVKKPSQGTRKIENPKFPVDFFEHCQQMQYTDIEFGGNDILHVYNRQQVKHRFSVGGLYIANTKPGGFTMEVHNLIPGTTVMVGIRMMVGCRSLERAPSSAEIFGRTHPISFPAGSSRWVDIPFTRDESVQAEKSFKINFGPSLDPSGVSLIDCIKVYGKARDVFGWPDHPPPPLPSPKVLSHELEEEDTTEVMPLTSAKPLSPTDRLVCNALCVLGNHFISVDQSKWPDVSDIISKATLLLMYSVPFKLQCTFKFLMASMAENKDLYHQHKDRVQLAHVINVLVSRKEVMEPEYYQYLLLMLLTIAKNRPENLQLVTLPELSAKFLQKKRKAFLLGDKDSKSEQDNDEGSKTTEEQKEASGEKEAESGQKVKGDDGKEKPEDVEEEPTHMEKVRSFIELFNDMFWRIFVRRPAAPGTAPVVSLGFAAMDITVTVMTELLWCFLLQDHTLLKTCFKYTTRFILAPDSHLCETSLQVLMRVLKPKKPKKDEVETVLEVSESAAIEEVDHEAPKPQEPKEQEDQEERQEEAEPDQPPQPEEEEPPPPAAAGDQEGELERGLQNLEEAWHEHLGQQQQQQQPMLNLEEALGNPAEVMEQLLANPEQYMLAMQGLMPDEDAMMNLAIALSLQEEAGGGGGGEASQAFQAALQGLGLPVPGGVQPPPPERAEGEEQEGANEQVEDQVVPQMVPQVVPQMVPDDQQQEEGEDVPHDHDDRRSCSSSSLFSSPDEPVEGVLRESTATPSDPQGSSQAVQGGGEVGGGGESLENQQDISSEPEMVNDSSGEDEPGEDDGSIVESLNQQLEEGGDSTLLEQQDGGGDPDNPVARLASLRKQMLSILLDHLYLVEIAGGMRSICFMQLILFILTNLECTREDCETLVSTLKTLIKQLEFENENMKEVVERDQKREVLLLYLRLFNILMSRKKLRTNDTKSLYASHMLWFATARTLLKDSQCMAFSRRTLRAIMEKKECLEVVEETPPLGDSLLHPEFTHPLTDMSPFFQKQYVKGHSNDIFSAYGRLLAEIVLVLPLQLKKMSEITKHLPTPEFGPEWIETLCDYLLKVAQTTGVGRRHVRKLLLHICGSKEKYRMTRDVHALKSYMLTVREVCRSGGFDPEQHTGIPVHLPYKATLQLIEQLKACDEVASTRTGNWQAFCLDEKSTLPYLFHSSFVLDEGLAPLILQLIHTALSGTPPKTGGETKGGSKGETGKGPKGGTATAEKGEKEDKKDTNKTPPTPAPDKETCQSLVQLFLSFVDDESLVRFIRLFLLQSNSTPLRWQAHSLIHCLYQYCQPAEQVHLVELLWQLWPNIPSYGHKASQFVDLLGYFTISTPQVLEKESLCQMYVERAIALLKRQNELVSTHPNSHIYSQLLSLVDFDGYYLESEPCLVCNDPEVPYNTMKLYSIKSEVRYSPNMILVKLVGSYTFSQVILRISDIKRTKMVRTVNLYYSNRTVQNVIELKNKRGLWLKARTCNLSPGQTEVKIDFPLPIVACNVIIEFADFYDNLQGGSEMLQCPRCQASVPAHPGVCGTCGENVYQCHKCRAINYDEKDPFLCNACGFSKYAKFEISVEAKTCSAVDPIETEEDRQKTLSNINTLLEQADKAYKLLVQHRNDLDQLLISLASGHTLTSGRAALLAGETGVNKGIQLVAHRYCIDCKTTYQELSKIIQGVLASRRELVKYDQKKMELGGPPITPSEPSTPALVTPTSSHVKLLSFPTLPSTITVTPHTAHEGRCFGCTSAATEHCITLLKALAFKPETRQLLVRQNLIGELVDFNLRSGGTQMQRDIRRLLCHLTRDDPGATTELNDFVLARVVEQITPQRISPHLASAVRPEMLLLSASLDMEDTCWEQRLRTVVTLFRKSQSHPSPAVMAGVTMPCLKILQSLIYPKDSISAKNKKKPLLEVSSVPLSGEQISFKASEWLRGDPKASFNNWREAMQKKVVNLKSLDKEELHRYQLMEKYANIWKSRTKKLSQFRSSLRQASWLRSMLFNPNSQSARKSTCNMIASLCQGEARQRQILDLLYSFLDNVGGAGEHCQEFLELLQTLTEEPTGKWKSYLAMRGVLPKIGALIAQEINHLLELEETTLSSDLSQGYALKMLTALLQSFLQVERIKQLFKSKLVGMVLNGYLSLKRLVVQRTKRIDETQELLLEMLEDLTSGKDEERQEFMAICVETLNKFKKNDVITPVFVFERLCNIIHAEEKDVGDFYLSLEKDPQQEEFLQGRMQGNPYPSSTPGLGPLMRDVKNKICTDCELIALLEDDTGMELLVCNKIISLDLPVKEVFKKIWCAQPNHGECMRVVYRMRGLLGDATEEFIEKLEVGQGKDVNEEEVYKMAAILSKCGGMDAILTRLVHVGDFLQSHHLISAALKLLSFCVKLKANRTYLLQPHLNTLNILLGTLNLALHHEETQGTGIGAAVAETILEVTERILQEASSAQTVMVTVLPRQEIPQTLEGDHPLHMLLKHIETPFVQSHPSMREGLLTIIPFLTFGDPRNMTVLLEYFKPYLNFEKFNEERSAENRLYLDCFCVIASGIRSDASGEKLKDLAIEMGLTPTTIAYLKQKVPQKTGTFDSPEWKEYVSQPSLPYVLKLLTGLCKQHGKTQLALVEVISELHLLEQVASEEHIGTMAENLLEAMMDNSTCKTKIKEARKATREEKKRKAMAMREKELVSLGLEVNEKGQVIAKPSLLEEIESEVEEEAGVKCCICLEGYRNHPQKVLGVYTYTRKVTLDEFEAKPRKSVGYCTVSHFNVVHYDCHSAAVKLARARDEWESAMLQNANTKCNGLMPIWGPEVSDSAFASCLARHNSYLQECTGLYDPSFHSLAHDLKLLLLRFAYEKSFSAESGGGGPQSNLFLIPYLMHIAIYILNTTRTFQREERNLTTFLIATPDKHVPSAYELDGPLYAIVQSLFVHTLQQWEEHRLTFLKRLIVLVHARRASASSIKNLQSPEPAEYATYKPMLILYGLVDGLQQMLKKSITATGVDMAQAVLDFIRNNDVAILEGCDKLLVKYQEALLPAESFEEFCDIVGLLGEVEDPAAFLGELLASLTSD